MIQESYSFDVDSQHSYFQQEQQSKRMSFSISSDGTSGKFMIDAHVAQTIDPFYDLSFDNKVEIEESTFSQTFDNLKQKKTKELSQLEVIQNNQKKQVQLKNIQRSSVIKDKEGNEETQHSNMSDQNKKLKQKPKNAPTKNFKQFFKLVIIKQKGKYWIKFFPIDQIEGDQSYSEIKDKKSPSKNDLKKLYKGKFRRCLQQFFQSDRFSKYFKDSNIDSDLWGAYNQCFEKTRKLFYNVELEVDEN